MAEIKIELTPEQLAILNGEKGETMAKIMKTLVMYGETFGATKMVPVTGKKGHLVTSFGIKVMKPVYELMDRQMTFEQALRTREFEDDKPNFTPRISGIIHREGGEMNFALSILKSAEGDDSSCERFTYAYSNPLPGRAKFIHTYRGDGNPLPSFEGEPKTLQLPDMDIDSLTELIWSNLNSDNKVSLFVRYIDIASGETETRIVNKNI